jgi:hypothetical protein
VILVSQQQLKGVWPWSQGNLRLGLTSAEVEVIEVVGDWLIKRWQLGVDQQVVMTRVNPIQASGCDPHVTQAETDGHFRRNCRAIL